MNYYERKIYRAEKKAKKYIRISYFFDVFVVLAGLNIVGSYISLLSAPLYFLLSASISVCVILLCYNMSKAYAIKASNIIKRSQKPELKVRNNGIKYEGRLIHIDFNKKKLSDEPAEGQKFII